MDESIEGMMKSFFFSLSSSNLLLGERRDREKRRDEQRQHGRMGRALYRQNI
jgi:hypothetical protein